MPQFLIIIKLRLQPMTHQFSSKLNQNYEPENQSRMQVLTSNQVIKQTHQHINHQSRSQKIGEWSQNQILKYFIFVFHHKSKFLTKTQRKSNKIFKKMSKFINTRTSVQCRTHHENIIKKMKNISVALQLYMEQSPQFFRKYNLAKKVLLILEQQEFLQDDCKVIKMCQIPTKKEDLDSNQAQKVTNLKKQQYWFNKKQTNQGIYKTDKPIKLEQQIKIYQQNNLLQLKKEDSSRQLSKHISTQNQHQLQDSTDKYEKDLSPTPPNIYSPPPANNLYYSSIKKYSQMHSYYANLSQCHNLFMKWILKLQQLKAFGECCDYNLNLNLNLNANVNVNTNQNMPIIYNNSQSVYMNMYGKNCNINQSL